MSRFVVLIAAAMVAVALAATAAMAQPESASEPVTSPSHAWGPYHWHRSSNPFTVVQKRFGLDSEWITRWKTAAKDWTKSDVLNATVPKKGKKQKAPSCAPISGQDVTCAGHYGNTGWLGLATIWIDANNHITQGLAQMNDTYLKDNPSYNTGSWRQLVICQEVGHTFGLAHQDENFDNPNLGTCMDYTANPDGPPSNLHPNKHDYDELDAIYAHLDAAAAGPPVEMQSIDATDPAQRGELVEQTDAYEIYERDLGNGNKAITRVDKAVL